MTEQQKKTTEQQRKEQQQEKGKKSSEILLKYMSRCDLKQAHMAKELNVSKTTVGNWINGRHVPEFFRIPPLADLFKLHGEERDKFLEDMGYLPNFGGKQVTVQQVVFLEAFQINKEEQELLEWLQAQLREAGYQIKDDIPEDEEVNFTLPIPVILFLSPTNLYNETLSEKVYQLDQAIQAKSHFHLLPLYVDLEETPFPQGLNEILSLVEALHWDKKTVERSELLHRLQEKLRSPSPRVVRSYELEMVGGAIPLDSKFYISRTRDSELQNALARRDSIVLVKGPRQVGKTSLLARGLDHARRIGSVVLFTDFQRLVDAQLQDLEAFFKAVGDMFAEQLNLEVSLSEKWKKEQTANVNFDRYFRREILGQTEKNVLWAIDEADKILPYPFSSDVFAMFRTWHNSRATFVDTPCVRLTLAIAYSTEPYLFIKELHQSPFNVGTKIELKDFTLEQVNDLNQRHGCPLTSKELEIFYQWVGGHPYLVRCALYELVQHPLPFTQFVQQMVTNEGIFGDHLRRIVMILKRDPVLHEAMRNILRQQPCPDYDSFFRLNSAGIVVGSKDEVKLRCKVYEQYLKKWLLE